MIGDAETTSSVTLGVTDVACTAGDPLFTPEGIIKSTANAGSVIPKISSMLFTALTECVIQLRYVVE